MDPMYGWTHVSGQHPQPGPFYTGECPNGAAGAVAWPIWVEGDISFHGANTVSNGCELEPLA